MSRYHSQGPDACGAPWSEHATMPTSKNRSQRICPDEVVDLPTRPSSGPSEPDSEELFWGDWGEDYIDDWPLPKPNLLDPVPGADR